MCNGGIVDLRLFHGESGHLFLFFRATEELESDISAVQGKLRDDGVACTAALEVFSMLPGAVKKRAHGPTDKSVRVLLFKDVNDLAAALDPRVFYSQASDAAVVVERAVRAARSYFCAPPLFFPPPKSTTLTMISV